MRLARREETVYFLPTEQVLEKLRAHGRADATRTAIAFEGIAAPIVVRPGQVVDAITRGRAIGDVIAYVRATHDDELSDSEQTDTRLVISWGRGRIEFKSRGGYAYGHSHGVAFASVDAPDWLACKKFATCERVEPLTDGRDLADVLAARADDRAADDIARDLTRQSPRLPPDFSRCQIVDNRFAVRGNRAIAIVSWLDLAARYRAPMPLPSLPSPASLAARYASVTVTVPRAAAMSAKRPATSHVLATRESYPRELDDLRGGPLVDFVDDNAETLWRLLECRSAKDMRIIIESMSGTSLRAYILSCLKS